MAFYKVDKKIKDGGGSSWIASLEYGKRSGEELKLQENRDELFVHGEISDDETSYDYDDWALVQLENDFYLLTTSGCSCPSPSETWYINMGPCSLSEIQEKILNGDYDGYTVPARQKDQFLQMIKEANG